MFEHVIVGVAEGQGSRDAIALAEQLVDPAGVVSLAHVYPPDLKRPALVAVNGDPARRDGALELLERAREQARVDARLLAIPARSPGEGLHALAQEEGADLLVVGSSRRRPPGPSTLTDDTHEALNDAPCAVAIAPAGYAQHPARIRTIGVGYNDSPESDNAIRHARTLAARYGAKLSAFEAVSLPSYTFIGGAVPLEDEELDEMVDAARARIAALGGIEPHAGYGITCNQLVAYSANVDLLVLGSRGAGPVGRLVHGSTSEALAGATVCPLLVLTRAG
jgi:nucleotide-binding universal stress UspA family protein